MSGESLLIYICNFHVLNDLLLIYICKLHWNLKERKIPPEFIRRLPSGCEAKETEKAAGMSKQRRGSGKGRRRADSATSSGDDKGKKKKSNFSLTYDVLNHLLLLHK